MPSTVTKTSQVVAEWIKIFPGQAVKTYTSSLTFIKQLTVVAVSTITYLKNVIDEDDYTTVEFAGLKLRILKNECRNDLGNFFFTSLTQAFEAIEKKYLHQIALCFYEHESAPENLLEYHLIEYTYHGGEAGSISLRPGGGQADAPQCSFDLDAVRERTLQLLRAIMVMMQDHRQMPDNYDVTMRLYYNENAPLGYQAPGFSPAVGDDGISGGTKLGWVSTPFHRMQMRTKLRDRSETPTDVLSQHSVEQNQSQNAFAGSVLCECGRKEETELGMMLTCSFCGTLQHAVCYGVLGPRAPRSHCCVPCALHAPDRHTDQGLARAANRVCFAIFRRALHWLQSAGGARVSVRALDGALALGPTSARKLMRVLRQYSVIHGDLPANPDTDVEIMQSQLKKLMQNFFRSPSPEDDMASRLLEESQCSQRSDMLTEVLSPMERVSLQATASTSRVVQTAAEDNQVSQPAKQDSTLAQYRSALTPLDGNKSPAAILKTPRKRKQNGGGPGERTKRMRKSRD